MNPSARPGAKPKRRPPIVLVVIVLAFAAYGAHRLYLSRQPYEWSGTVEARTISVGSRAGGRIQRVLVGEGESVAKGQPILELEPGDWPSQLVQAMAQKKSAEAVLDKLRKGARPEELEQARARALTAKAILDQAIAGSRPEQIQAAQARVAAQEIVVQKAKLDADRMHKLDSAGAAVPADLDNADMSLREAVAQRDALQGQLDELKNGSRREEVAQARARQMEQTASVKLVVAGTRAEDLRVAEADVEAAGGRVAQIQSMLDELTIRAPLAARVEALDLRPGDIISPNAAAAVLLEEKELYVRIYVPETLLGRLRVGQAVPITVDSFPDRAFRGVVTHINEVGEYSPRNLQTADERADQVFATRVELHEGFDELRAGMAAFITVPR
ncbi:MAG TPA: efflux RND transporter periplasmic adaptor subunit [Polyangiaceae bacterium]|jgi:multidrug resistance efflux pump|nr:efflux RND transporter periplasmic adaptor subunit [Polyangiaceae bacterium]